MNDAAGFERLLGDLSTRFAGVPSERVDGEIDYALEQLVGLLGTDRSTLLELLPEGGAVAVSHSWARPGVSTTERSLLVSVRFPWYHERLRRGDVLRFERTLDELPIDAAPERAYAAALPMLSHVAVPLLVDGKWVCALLTATARSYRSWHDADIEKIRIVGQILANAVYRAKLERELRESCAEVQRLQRRFAAENEYLRQAVGSDAAFEQIAGKSRVLREVLEQAAQVAPTDATVLLLGETGTGKELLARAIHARSKRREGPLSWSTARRFRPRSSRASSSGTRRAPSRARRRRSAGRFELADGGTLFLDEIGEIPPELQAKLLRVLEERRVRARRRHRARARSTCGSSPRRIAISSARSRRAASARISTTGSRVFPIQLPPLRDRREDIPLLVWDLIERQTARARAADRARLRERDAGAHPLRMAGKHPRAQQRDRARADPLAGAGARDRGPPLVDAIQSRVVGAPRRSGARALPARARALQWRITGAGNAADTLGMRPSTLRSRLKKLGISRPVSPRI